MSGMYQKPAVARAAEKAARPTPWPVLTSTEPLDALGVPHPDEPCDHPAPVVAHEPYAAVAERVEQREHIAGELLLAASPAGRVRPPQTAEIRGDHAVLTGQAGDDLAPSVPVLRPAVQKHDGRRAGSPASATWVRQAPGVDPFVGDAGEGGGRTTATYPPPMPEGDTIAYVAKRMRPVLVGRVPEEVRTPHPRHRLDRWPERLSGREVASVDTHGKHLFLRFAGDLTLHSHLRMTGSWATYAHGRRWRRSPRRAWLVLAAQGHDIVQFDGPVLELMTESRARFDLRLAALGPDILAPELDEAAFLRRLREDDPTRGIGDALLDQRTIAGIGNMWKAEGCWQAQIDPWRRTADVSDAEALAIVRALRPLMRESAETGHQSRSRHIHDRAGRPCPRGAESASAPAARARTTGRRSGARRVSGEARRPQGRGPHRPGEHARLLRRRARRGRRHDRVRHPARALGGRELDPVPGSRLRRSRPAACHGAHARRGTRPSREPRVRRHRARRRPEGPGYEPEALERSASVTSSSDPCHDPVRGEPCGARAAAPDVRLGWSVPKLRRDPFRHRAFFLPRRPGPPWPTGAPCRRGRRARCAPGGATRSWRSGGS